MQYTANEVKKITAQIKNKFSIICSKMSGKIGINKFVNLRICRFDGINSNKNGFKNAIPDLEEVITHPNQQIKFFTTTH